MILGTQPSFSIEVFVGYGVIFVKVVKAYIHQKTLLERHSCRLWMVGSQLGGEKQL